MDDYLREHPDLEKSLWREWVLIVCSWDQYPPPTQAEWEVLRQNWQHGKAPIDSVGELRRMRKGLS